MIWSETDFHRSAIVSGPLASTCASDLFQNFSALPVRSTASGICIFDMFISIVVFKIFLKLFYHSLIQRKYSSVLSANLFWVPLFEVFRFLNFFFKLSNSFSDETKNQTRGKPRKRMVADTSHCYNQNSQGSFSFLII